MATFVTTFMATFTRILTEPFTKIPAGTRGVRHAHKPPRQNTMSTDLKQDIEKQDIERLYMPLDKNTALYAFFDAV